ncbi:MAG: hypothetical protein EOM70_09055 [Clostridia bacterium]|nr:hypothetical protein [Clostridia bacterium]
MGLHIVAFNLFSFVEGIDTLQAVIFMVGLLLLLIEVFTPGFGIAGGGGIVLLITGIILTARTPFEAVIMAVILFILLAALLAIILRSAKKGRLSRKLILWSSSNREAGFSTSADTSIWIGKEGVALSTLRPAGTAQFDNQRLDVVTEGAYIETGTKVRVIRAEGRRIVVEPVN